MFVNVIRPDKEDPQRLYHVGDYDFRLKPGSSAVDAGIALPGITDGFARLVTDPAAYESDRPLPHNGPRDDSLARYLTSMAGSFRVHY